MRRANRLGGGYQPIQEEPEEIADEGELYLEPEYTEEDSILMRRDNLPIGDLNKYNTDTKEAKYIRITHIVGNLTVNKKSDLRKHQKGATWIHIGLKTLVSKIALDMPPTCVRSSLRRQDRETTPVGYQPVFEKLSIRWGLLNVDDQILVPIDIRS